MGSIYHGNSSNLKYFLKINFWNGISQNFHRVSKFYRIRMGTCADQFSSLADQFGSLADQFGSLADQVCTSRDEF